ncbi:MAG: nucleotidyltransferase family protein [Gemmatimonadota bacterium]|nr:nucleotidyltransferase family protein [Gemmatimonadota bacterium]
MSEVPSEEHVAPRRTLPERARPSRMESISKQEKKSLTHGDFWIPDDERDIYKRALHALNAAGVPYIVAGAYAIYEHTGIYRETKDLDLFCEPEHVADAMRALKTADFRARLEQPHWLAKALDTNSDKFVDVIYGMGNGLQQIDHDWYRHSRPAILAATPVRVAPPEELLWHRLFISERHRQDTADIAHLIASVGRAMDWNRIMHRTGEHWPLLLAQLTMFFYVYPECSHGVPDWVYEELLRRADAERRRPRTDEKVTRGPLVSRFSFAIDVNEWGYRDLREATVDQAEHRPAIVALAASDVWDERSPMAEDYDARIR